MDFFLPASDLQLKLTTPQYRELLARWIEADPDHREHTRPEFFMTQAPGQECYALEDRHGVVFFLKVTRTATLDVQFPPETDEDTIERVRRGLREGFPWLADVLATRGYQQVSFVTAQSRLARFCAKRLGFARTGGELLVRYLTGRAK